MSEVPLPEKTWTVDLCPNCGSQKLRNVYSSCGACGVTADSEKHRVISAEWRALAYEREVEIGVLRRSLRGAILDA